jgi:hypothetical protein
MRSSDDRYAGATTESRRLPDGDIGRSGSRTTIPARWFSSLDLYR